MKHPVTPLVEQMTQILKDGNLMDAVELRGVSGAVTMIIIALAIISLFAMLPLVVMMTTRSCM
jgi:hypothetical protein